MCVIFNLMCILQKETGELPLFVIVSKDKIQYF